jgi:membrane-bound lytic murein transglycosylase B
MDNPKEPVRRTYVVVSVLQAVAVVGAMAWVGSIWAGSAPARGAAEYASLIVETAPIPTAPLLPAAPVAPPRSIAARIDPIWLDRIAAATGIPRRTLAAYAGASLALATEKPQCHLGWNTLAAIGHIESDDGRHGGAVVSDNGYPSVPIIGPRLDGGAFAGIHDSDGGVWDGDTVWDHAVGPFQFIPQTWRTWGADGNGDGRADPNQVDDAALTAARYLCHAGDLSTVDGWRRAVRSYNHSDQYVDDVARVANALTAAASS